MAQKEIPGSSILIAHLADIHLRDSQYATARRGIDFFASAKDAVQKACKAADVLVLVGDNFDKARPSPRVISQLMQLDRILQEAGKVCLAVTGNHDWSDPTWLDTLFPGRIRGHTEDGLDAVSEKEYGIIPVDGRRVSYKGFIFAGIKPYTVGHFRAHLAEVTVQARGADVVLYHGLVDGVVPFYIHAKDPLHISEFPVAKENKAWLLGDVHMQGYRIDDRPGGGKVLTGYPDSTEMCSALENPEKRVPIIKLTKDAADVVDYIPIKTRPFIAAEVATEEQLDALMKRITPVADQHPVVVCKFDRGLTQTINRLHSTLDAQRAVIRCYPLPSRKVVTKREKTHEGQEELSMEHFVSKRFEGRNELETVALSLLHRGESDAENIVTAFIERRLESVAIRED